MTIKWAEQGESSGWEVWVGAGHRRLFVARKMGGREEALKHAQAEEARMRSEAPSLARRVLQRLRTMLSRKGQV